MVASIFLVPSARLELAQLSPLPPQDSVSTNFTTTAALSCLDCVRNLAEFALRTDREFTLNLPLYSEGQSNYFEGICAAPDAGTAGAGAVCAGATTAALSSTLPELAGCAVPKRANANVLKKNTVAKTAVVRERKFALPLAPNKLPEPPLPKAAPMSAPLPCCTSTKPIMPTAESSCTVKIMVTKMFTVFLQK
jgi:hypothetical protein